MTNLSHCLTNAANRYGKPIIIAETAFPWTNTCFTTNIFNFVPSTNGQASFIAALAPIIKTLPNNLGLGVFYWGTEYQAVNGVNEAGFNTASLFDVNGNLLPAADAVGGLSAPITLSAALTTPNLIIHWPLSGAGLKLATTTNLSSTALWSAVTSPAPSSNTSFTITLPLNGTHFYRLQSN